MKCFKVLLKGFTVNLHLYVDNLYPDIILMIKMHETTRCKLMCSPCQILLRRFSNGRSVIKENEVLLTSSIRMIQAHAKKKNPKKKPRSCKQIVFLKWAWGNFQSVSVCVYGLPLPLPYFCTIQRHPPVDGL